MSMYDEQILICQKYVEELSEIRDKLYEFYDKYGEVSGEHTIRCAIDYLYKAEEEINGVVGDMEIIENFEDYEDEQN